MVGMEFAALAERILDRADPIRLVAIDGPGGSGKTTFAARLAAALSDAPVVHTDDFASWDNPIDWWPRCRDQVIKPLSRGERASYQRFDWNTGSLADWVEVDPVPVVIIEGVSAARAQWRHSLSYIIWIETPPGVRLRRGLERDGDDALDDWRAWGAAEDRHYAVDRARRHADLIVDGTAPLTPTSFTTLADSLTHGAWHHA